MKFIGQFIDVSGLCAFFIFFLHLKGATFLFSRLQFIRKFGFLSLETELSPLSESLTLGIFDPIEHSRFQEFLLILLLFHSVNPSKESTCLWRIDIARDKIGHDFMCLWLELRLQVFLSAIINLNLMIEVFNLHFMFFLAPFQLFNITEVNLLALWVHCILPNTESLIGHELIYTLNSTQEKSLSWFLVFYIFFPGVHADIDGLVFSHTAEPIYFVSNIFKSLSFFDLLPVLIKSIPKPPSLNSLGTLPHSILQTDYKESILSPLLKSAFHQVTVKHVPDSFQF